MTTTPPATPDPDLPDPDLPHPDLPHPDLPVPATTTRDTTARGTQASRGTQATRARVTRRTVVAGAVAAGLMSSGTLRGLAQGARFPQVSPLSLAQVLGQSPTFVRTVRRREDMLLLQVLGFGVAASQGQLVRVPGGPPPTLVFTLAPQAVAEAAFDTGTTPAGSPILHRIAGPSRLAFDIPEAALPLPLSTAALTDFAMWGLQVVPSAEDQGGAASLAAVPRPPRLQETALEMPWRVVLSPPSSTTFVHEVLPETSQTGVTSLWHARLAGRRPVRMPRPGVTLGGGPDEHRAPRRVRAVWALDYDQDLPDPSGLDAALDPLRRQDRRNLVNRTARGDRIPARAERLWVSPLGGWLQVDGSWPQASDNDLLAWEHQLALGRDQRVQVTRSGFLFPYGHRAAQVVVKTRTFEQAGGTGRAILRRRTFLVITQQTKEYGADAAPAQPDDGRAWPLRRLTFSARVTPDAEPPGAIPGFASDEAFVLARGGAPVLLDATGVDWDGRTIRLQTPVVFVNQRIAFPSSGPSRVPDLVAAFEGDGIGFPRTVDLRGQRVALAPSLRPGDTSVDVRSFVLAAQVPRPGEGPAPQALLAAGQPPFYPAMAEATVGIPGAAPPSSTPGGAAPAPPPEPTVVFDNTYLQQGFDAAGEYLAANAAAVFAQTKAYAEAAAADLLDELVPDDLPIPPELAGGLVNPTTALTGLSRELGIAGGQLDALKDVAKLPFDPASFFGAGAKLLGGIKLTDILGAIGLPTSLPDIPEQAEFVDGPLRVVSRTIGPPPIQPGPDDPIDVPIPQPPTAVETTIDFVPKLKGDDLGVFVPNAAGRQARLAIHAFTRVDLQGGGTSTAQATGELTDFQVVLFGDAYGFIGIRFNRLRFEAGTGRKTVLDPDIAEVSFLPPLDFVNELRNYMKGACIVPGVDITPQGISASYSVVLPSIGVGIFSLANISLAAGFEIPFRGGPARALFSFSTREDPFTLSVGIFGGSGYVALALGTDGLERVEVSLEFGAMASISIAVASGSVSLTAGVSFLLAVVEDPAAPDGEATQVTLTGFLRLRGEVRVLGIATVSAMLELSLAYDSSDGAVVGRGILVLEVDVLVLSERFEVEMERRFGGSGGDTGARAERSARTAALGRGGGAPTFAEQISAAQWADYAAAFAGGED